MSVTWSTTDVIVSAIVIAIVVYLLLVTPLFKPWFGLRKPKGHPGKWGD